MSKEIKQFILRRQYKPEATKGFLIDPDFLNGEGDLEARKICETLERPNLNNQKDDPKTVENESSCIPEGTYLCKKYTSPKYSNTWEITGIKGRDLILFHCANYTFQLKGCVAVCNQVMDMNPKNDPKFDKERRWYASQSKDGFETFKKAMPKEFQLKIISDEFFCNA